MRRSVRGSCGLAGHVRARHRRAKVSTRWPQAGSQTRPTLRAPRLPWPLWAARSPAPALSPPPIFHPATKRGARPEMGIRNPTPPHASARAHSHPPPPQPPRRLGRIVKEAAATVVEKAASARPCEPLGRPRPGGRGEETAHFSPRDGRGPRELAAETQGQAYSPGGCGLLRLNSRVGGGQTTQPWVSPDTVPPPRLVGTSPEQQRAHTGGRSRAAGPLPSGDPPRARSGLIAQHSPFPPS